MTSRRRSWERFARVARRWGTTAWTGSISDEFHAPGVPLDDPEQAQVIVRSYLRRHPALVAHWARYLGDRRSSPSPVFTQERTYFFDPTSDPMETEVVHHPDAASACADYVVREAFWVLERRRVGGERDPG